MAAPTAPTLTSIRNEALSKAGYDNPATALVTRVEDEFMEEIKNDIAIRFKGKELKFLQTSRILTLTDNKSEYDEPTDFLYDISKTLLYGGNIGTASAGGANTITLETDIDATGKEIVIISGTGANQSREVISYVSATKVATVASNWDTNPDATSKYVIVDTYDELCEKPIWERDLDTTPYQKGRPRVYYPLGDEDNGRFILYPIPYRNITNNAYIVKQRYYANLMKLDLSGTLMSTLYQRWRNLWITGIVAKLYEWDDDSRYANAITTYFDTLNRIVDSELYSTLTSNVGYVRPAY